VEILFETIHYGGFSFSPIAIIIYGGLLFYVVAFVIIPSIKKQYLINKERSKLEKELTEQNGQRLLCLDCPYCKNYIHRTFYTSNALSYRAPIYCRKFKIKFAPGRLGQRCQAKDPKKAMREKHISKS
jgi:hypothetical protein